MSEYTETLSKTTHFLVNGELTAHRFVVEVNADAGITPNCIRIDTASDAVYVVFDATLSAGEITILQGLAAVHVPDQAYEAPDLIVDPTTKVLMHRLDSTMLSVNTRNQYEISISPDPGIGQYSTLSAAVAANPNPGTIYTVFPGTYVENNPIVVPAYAEVRARGTPGNTILIAANQTQDMINLGPWCKLSRFIITGSVAPGQKNTCRGVYFNGGVGFGGFSLVEECIVTNFDTCIETSGAPTGSHTLLLHRVQVAATTAPLTNGVRAHTQGQIISNSFVAAGTPVPLAPIPLPFGAAIKAEDTGTKVSVNITSVLYCTHTCVVDNGGEIEITLLSSTGCNTAICIGPTGTNSKLRAVNFNMKNSITYDLDIMATDAQLDLIGAQMDESKINNPNGVKVNAQFHGNKGGKNYQAITGDVRIGTVEEPTNLAIGEGKYNVDSFVALQNDNLEVGTWTDISTEVKSETDGEPALFAGTAAGNCIYIGADQIPKGVKINVITAVTLGNVQYTDVMPEYWNGTTWTYLPIMSNNAETPFYFRTSPFVNEVGKYQIRFGLHNGSTIAKKTLNGYNKYWCRWRIVNTWSSVPEIEYIKMHTNSTEINKDGFLEYFGDARPISKLDWSIIMTEPANSTPDSQDVYLSDQLGVGRVNNKFKDNTTDRIGLNEFLPTDLDTSFPVKIKFSIVGDTAATGNVEFIARWNVSNNGSNIYRTTAAAPTSSSGEKSASTIIAMAAADVAYRGEIVVDLAGVNPNPSNGQPDLLWLSIERNATGGNTADTYAGNVTIVQMGVYYIKWRDGGHITGY